jgi:competence protein ComEA
MALSIMVLAVLVGTQVAGVAETNSGDPKGAEQSTEVTATTSRERCSCDPDALVRINHADAKVLCTLPGIGPAKAERIIVERTRRPFRKPTDLRRVKGFGRKTIQRLAPRLSFE